MCLVGRGKLGVGAGICWLAGGSDDSLACAEGVARNVEAATAAARAAAAGHHRSIRRVLGCLCIFCSSRGVSFVEDGLMPCPPHSGGPADTTCVIEDAVVSRENGVWVGPRVEGRRCTTFPGSHSTLDNDVSRVQAGFSATASLSAQRVQALTSGLRARGTARKIDQRRRNNDVTSAFASGSKHKE